MDSDCDSNDGDVGGRRLAGGLMTVGNVINDLHSQLSVPLNLKIQHVAHLCRHADNQMITEKYKKIYKNYLRMIYSDGLIIDSANFTFA
jgi:hypothetical protein